jgi:hypothetical protein
MPKKRINALKPVNVRTKLWPTEETLRQLSSSSPPENAGPEFMGALHKLLEKVSLGLRVINRANDGIN